MAHNGYDVCNVHIQFWWHCNSLDRISSGRCQTNYWASFPNVALRIRNAKTPCQLPRGTYLFGYDLNVRTDQGEGNFGRICRDILNGGWVWAFDDLDKKGGL